ncbi:MAG: protein-L-isoaspartate(D-aspartate) O-methyltransferase [Polyangiaceae bacterium]
MPATLKKILCAAPLLGLAACRQASGPADDRTDAATRATTDAAVAPPAPTRGSGSPPAPTSSADATVDSAEAREARQRLVRQIAAEPPWTGQRWDERVLSAIGKVPRHAFLPGAPLRRAYDDHPQPIGHEQTISQPMVVAIMSDALDLQGNERVLEIGTGSGYQAAVLAELARQVYTIEIVTPLGETARRRLAELGYRNIEVRIGDGYAGWPEAAPFDRVLLTAAPEAMPEALLAQLAEGGIAVAPVGRQGETQRLARWTKREGKVTREDLGAVRFVPMVPGR